MIDLRPWSPRGRADGRQASRRPPTRENIAAIPPLPDGPRSPPSSSPRTGPPHPPLQTPPFERGRPHHETRLDDPGLRAATLAGELGVPLRTLQDVFARRGETISELIRPLRLGRCHTDLQRADGRGQFPPDRSLRPRPAAQTAGRRASGGRALHRRPGHPRRHAHLPGGAAALGDADERHASRRPQPALDRPGAGHQ